MAFKSHRDASRTNYGKNENPLIPVTNEEINTGSLQRIADATEAMAKNYVNLQDELARYKRRYEQEVATVNRLQRSNNALRGHINRMKKAAK